MAGNVTAERDFPAELEKAQQRPKRAVFVYPVPPSLIASEGADFSELGFVQLTPHEELMAVGRAQNDAQKLAYELAKGALVEVNGKTVSLADGTTDTAWSKMPPKIRALSLEAYGDLHAPKEEEVIVFKKGRRTKIV